MSINIFTKTLMVGAASTLFALPVAADILGASANHVSSLKVEASTEQELISGAENFIGSMAQRAIGFLGDEELSQEQRSKKFEKLLNDSFDMKTLARFSLGRYWRVSTKQQKQEYLTLFKEMIVEVYSKRFSEYQGERLDVHGARADGKSDAIVTTFITSADGPKIQLDWRVRYKGGRYKVIDIIVEGISMAVTQRSDFSSVIQRGGGEVSVLLTHLK